MGIVVELLITGNNFFETPLWWQNFVEYVVEKHPEYNELPDVLQDKWLLLETKRFNGELMFEDTHDCTDVRSIVFDDEKHATFFIMKWS